MIVKSNKTLHFNNFNKKNLTVQTKSWNFFFSFKDFIIKTYVYNLTHNKGKM